MYIGKMDTKVLKDLIIVFSTAALIAGCSSAKTVETKVLYQTIPEMQEQKLILNNVSFLERGDVAIYRGLDETNYKQYLINLKKINSYALKTTIQVQENNKVRKEFNNINN